MWWGTAAPSPPAALPLAERWEREVVAPVIAAREVVSPWLQQARADANNLLSRYEPWQLVLGSFLAAVLLARVLAAARRSRRRWIDKGWKQVLSGFVLDLPGLRSLVRRQEEAVVARLRKGLAAKGGLSDAMLALPKEGIPAAQIKQRLARKAASDVRFAEGDSHVSGTVYLSGAAHQLLLSEVYKQFALTNPMHADVFPSVRRMEAEVVAMTAALLGGGPAGDPGVCGCMTSGGTESILSAVKTSRDYMAAVRGITEPEMVVADSAHAAFIKAAEYFKIRLVRVSVGQDFRLSGAAVRRAVGRNTVLVVASSPGFPHGVMDHVEDIAKVTAPRGIPLHVDCCLGGFVLPFARELGHRVPPFDFSVPGVTSISADTHKFGQAHKGTSVVLYRSAALRAHQYTSITDWSGGLYISPGFAGSRSGALIATAWAALVHMGREGYLAATQSLMAAAEQFMAGVEGIPGLEVMGQPEMCVVAVRATPGKGALNVYKVNELLTRRGWHLNALQRPAALHICFTAAHGPRAVATLVEDLRAAAAEAAADPGAGGEGMAPLYGMAATVPDRRIVGNFLVAYQDILLEPQ